MESKFQCVNVVASGHTTANLSRLSLLKWVNDLLNLKIQKVEALCSGTAYCQIMNLLFPGCISNKKIRYHPTQAHEFFWNFKQLQNAFSAVGCEKNVPIDILIKGRFQENFEFLQWFKRFYDANAPEFFETPQEVKQGSSKKQSRAIATIPPVRHSTLTAGLETTVISRLASEIQDYRGRAEKIVEEKDFYFNKLRNIEIMCTQEGAANMEKETLVNQILAELYATEEGFEIPDDTEAVDQFQNDEQ